MRKTYIYFFCLILSISATQLKAQNCWSPLGTGTNGYIEAIVTYNGELIVAGQFDSIGGIAANNIAAWNGSSWSALGSGVSSTYNPNLVTFNISALAIYNGELYAGGQFDTAGGVLVNNVAKWNGTSWSAIGTGIPGTNYTINALTVYNGSLYAGGHFDTAGGIPANNIARWDGTQWYSVDSGIGTNFQNVVYSLITNDGVLYVGGIFVKAGNSQTQNIAVWNDTVWSTLDNGINTQIMSMAFYQGNLYVSGIGSSNIDNISTWDGATWSQAAIATGTNTNIGVDALFEFDGKLIAAGGFDTIGGIAATNLAQWNGTTWSSFGETSGFIPYFTPGVYTLGTYNGYLYAGGAFIQVDSTNTNSIAEYTCATDGIHEVSVNHVRVYPNPTTGIINISIDNAEAGVSVQIYDLLGQKIYQSNISSSSTSINLSGHAAGSYLYHISGASGEGIAKGMIIIQ